MGGRLAVTRSPYLRHLRGLLASIIALASFHFAAQSSIAADQPARVSYAGHSIIRATAKNQRQLDRLMTICPRVCSEHAGVGDVDVIADSLQKRALDREGIAYTIVIDDLQPIIDQERTRLDAQQEGGVAGPSFFNDFRDYATVTAQLTTLANARPDLAQVIDVGTSLEGRAIKGIRISGSIKQKPGVLISACQHAREWITPMTAMYIATSLINGYDSDPQMQALLDSLEFYIVPIVNPDGYVYSWGPDRLWRKNRRPLAGGAFGVDLNRNWPIGFGGESTSTAFNNDLYPGTAPFSEPETQAVRDFAIAHPNIVTSLDLHSYSQLVLQPWSYTMTLPPAYTCIDEIGAAISSSILGVHGKHYPHGSGDGVIYLAGGTIHDWMFGDQGLLAYTIELRPEESTPGFILPASEIIPTGEEILAAVLKLADVSLDPVYVGFPQDKPEFVQADVPTTQELSLLPMSAGSIVPGTAKLFTRLGTSGPFTMSSLASLGNLNYEATFPAAPCNQVIKYYLQVETTAMGVINVPFGFPKTYFEVTPRAITVTFHDNMNTNGTWVVGAPGDDATTGVWERFFPNETYNGWGVPAQPGFDNPAGTGEFCWMTGYDNPGLSGINDVDGGTTTLISPTLNAIGDGDPYVSYYRWYSNNTGSNPNTETMPIEISNDNGATWTLLELVSVNETKWFYREFRIADYVTPTSTVKLRFVARDLTNNGGSIVEAGVDDFELRFVDCEVVSCTGDLVDTNTFTPPGDGMVDGADLAYLLGEWGRNPGSLADIVDTDTFLPPPDGVVDGADLAVLLGAWGGCR